MTDDFDIAVSNYGTESHSWVLEPYMQEITIQGKAFQQAIRRLNASLNGHGRTVEVFAASQSALTAAISITRLLWPTPASRDRDGQPLTGRAERARQWSIQRGKSLRRALDKPNAETSPLANRQVRNQFEHFDEYLDGFLLDVHEGTIPPVSVDMNIGPIESFEAGQEPGSTLRHYDTKNEVLSVLNVKMPLNELADEVARIEKLAEQWLLVPRAGPTDGVGGNGFRLIMRNNIVTVRKPQSGVPPTRVNLQDSPIANIKWKTPYEHPVRNDYN